jgi:hypothetical protein
VGVRETPNPREVREMRLTNSPYFRHTDITGTADARQVAQELCDHYGFSALEAVTVVGNARTAAIAEGCRINAATYVGAAIYRRNFA